MQLHPHFSPLSALVVAATLALAACKPPASDEYQQRGEASPERGGPMAPIDSPDTEGAVWADSNRAGRLLYGKPGEAPLIALECATEGDKRTIRITRFIAADAEAKALMALIGNGHTSRLPVDAQWNGRVWLWEGAYEASDSALDVLSGPRQIEATIPGAGSVILNPSQHPGRLLDRCRQTAKQPLAP